MDNVFNFIIDTRQAFIELIDSLSVEQLNQIPAGFNNNIIWNFGHIVVSTQGLCYARTGIKSDTSFIKYLSAYAKGTKPTYNVDAEEIADLRALALSTIQHIHADYDRGGFNTITPFETSTYKTSLNSIEEVLITTVGHDNLHFGYALAQRRALNNQ